MNQPLQHHKEMDHMYLFVGIEEEVVVVVLVRGLPAVGANVEHLARDADPPEEEKYTLRFEMQEQNKVF